MAIPKYTNQSVKDLLNYTYANSLGSTPSQENLDYWSDALQSGNVTMDNFQTSFNDYARKNNQTLLSDVALVNNVFENGLGRSATPEEKDFWTQELTSGRINPSNLVETMAIDYQDKGQAIDVTKVKEAVRDDFNSQQLGYDVSLAEPFSFTAPDFTTTDPSYQFRLQEGIDALDASAASRGMVQSGAQQKAITDYGQNLASTEYSNAYNRAADTYDRQQNAMLNLANYGQAAATNTATAGTNYGTNVTNALNTQGTATAQGITGASTASNVGLENALLALGLS